MSANHVRCSCIYCSGGTPHPHTADRFVPLIGSPHVSVCRNCGHKVLTTILDLEEHANGR